MKIPSILKFLPVVLFAIFNIPVLAIATTLPTNPTVVSGSATFDPPNEATMKVDVTSSGLTQIDWNSFSIGTGGLVTFQQLNSSDIVLNRVTGTGSSSINGSISGNGNVWLINSNGILIGSKATIDVGGFLAVAGTDSISPDATFMNGDSFNLTGSMENDGNIITNNGGYAVLMGKTVLNTGSINTPGGITALVGPSVWNEGTITADSGNIDLVSGTSPSISLDNSGDISIVVSPVNGPCTWTYCVENTGTLEANGGMIALTAFVENVNPATYVVNASGIIMANTLVAGGQGGLYYDDGQILLSSDGDSINYNSIGDRNYSISGTSAGTGASLVLTPNLSQSPSVGVSSSPSPDGDSPSPSPSPSPTGMISGGIITIDSAGNISDSANINAFGYGAEVSINAPNGTFSIENGSINVSEEIGLSGLSPVPVGINIDAVNTNIFGSNLSVTNISGNDATISIENTGALNIQSSSLTTLSWGGTGDISVTGNSFLISNSLLSSGSSNGGDTASIEVTGNGNAIDWIFGSSLIATEVGGATASITVTAPSDLMVDGSTISALNSYGANASIFLGNFSTIYNSSLYAESDKSIGLSEITLYPKSDLPNTDPATGIILPNGSVGLTFQYGIIRSQFLTLGGLADIFVGTGKATNLVGNLIIQFSYFIADSFGIPYPPGDAAYIQIGIQSPNFGQNYVLLQGDEILAHSFSKSSSASAGVWLDFLGAIVTTFPTTPGTLPLLNDNDLGVFTGSVVPNYLTTITAQANGGYALVEVFADIFYDISGYIWGSGVGGNSYYIMANRWCADNSCFPIGGDGSVTPSITPVGTPLKIPGTITQILSTSLTQQQPLILDVKDLDPGIELKK